MKPDITELLNALADDERSAHVELARRRTLDRRDWQVLTRCDRLPAPWGVDDEGVRFIGWPAGGLNELRGTAAVAMNDLMREPPTLRFPCTTWAMAQFQREHGGLACEWTLPEAFVEAVAQNGEAYYDSGGKQAKQIAHIIKLVREKGWDPLCIPEDGKATLRDIVALEASENPDIAQLFDGTTSFDNAWKAASRNKELQHVSAAKVTRRGRW
ncbi:MAG: hypothetical protein ACOZAQ_03145 [Pseudomonadota bacterium]